MFLISILALVAHLAARCRRTRRRGRLRYSFLRSALNIQVAAA